MRSIIILASVFATIVKYVMPLQFLQSFILTSEAGILSLSKIQYLPLITAFNNSTVIKSTPGDFPFCNLDIAALTSLGVGSLVAISSITPSTIHSSSSDVWLAASPRLSIHLKHSIHLACPSSLVLTSFPFLSNTAVLNLRLSLQIFFVSLYNVLIRRILAASSAVLAILSIHFLLSV